MGGLTHNYKMGEVGSENKSMYVRRGVSKHFPVSPPVLFFFWNCPNYFLNMKRI